MVEFGPMANMQIGEESSLDGMSELSKEVVNKELLMFIRFQVDVKNIKCPLKWWAKHESLFPIVAFLAHHILGIFYSQIEIEKKNSLARILTNLRKCHLQLDNLNKIFFVSKHKPSDLRVGCSSLSSLIELIEVDLALEEELEQYAGEFQRDELLDL
jgi:hypothetical protein